MKVLDIELKNREEKDPFFIPAVIYGFNIQGSIPCRVNRKEFVRLVKTNGRNIILNCKLDDGKVFPALIKDIQKDVINLEPIHVDFLAISLDKEIEITIPVHSSGDSIGVKMGGIFDQVTFKLQVKGKPKFLPEEINVDITACDIGTVIHASDLPLDKGIHLISAQDMTIMSILAPHIEVVAEPTEGVASSTATLAPGTTAPTATPVMTPVAATVAPAKPTAKFPAKKSSKKSNKK